MRTRTGSSAILAGAALLAACSIEAGNEAGDATESEPGAAGPEAPVAGGEAPAQQPGDGNMQGEPAAGVELSASPAQTRPNSTVTLSLRNGSDGQVGYNLCTSSLQMADGKDVPTNRVCTMELRTLEAGISSTYAYKLPVNMIEGNYRFATEVHWTASDRTSTVRSNAFSVSED